MAKICVIVLNYCTYSATLDCLESVHTAAKDSRFLQKGHDICLCVCDNGSEDDSIHHFMSWANQNYASEEWLSVAEGEQIQPQSIAAKRFVLVINGSNKGYAAGNNVALRLMSEHADFDYYLVLNSDVVVEQDSLYYLLKDATEKSDYSIFGGTIVFADSPDTIQCAGGWRYNPILSRVKPCFGGRNINEVGSGVDPRMDYIYGACMLVRAEVFRKCGFFNEDLFLYFEEIDFCLRARRKGFNLKWSQEAVIHHRHGHTVSKISEAQREYYEMWGVLTITGKYNPFCFLFVVPLRLVVKSFLFIARGKASMIGPLFRSCYDYFCDEVRKV
ncbi:glycosyltransferase family 2 protein [Maridesulfovibrio sp.]|uniref:glycosyltransferase family 2 protein n=1 Tax=Maridesulfovibrio sp. TaxID=2795000 RepID=UPI003BA88F70